MGAVFVVKMPDIGEGVVEGEVVEWLKQEGDSLKQDEPVVVVMTDKATVELPAPYPGTLTKQHFKPGQIAVKDQPLYEIETAMENIIEPLHLQPPSTCLQGSFFKTEKSVSHKEKKTKGLATPPVRHLAKQLNISLSSIQGTGKDGRITLEDLQATKHEVLTKVPVVSGDLEKPLLGVKRLMAEKMKTSKDHIPHFSYFESVEVSRLVAMRQKVKLQALEEGLQATFMPFFIRTLSLCIKKYPEINSSFDESSARLLVHTHQHVGVAVAGPQGLVVAVIHDVQEMGLDALVRAYEDVKKRAVEGRLSPMETKGSTITISNFGAFGGRGLWATPIINYPEAAILALDRIQKQPIVKNGEVVARDVLNASWSFDHRIIDGEMAAEISKTFCDHVSNPASLL